MFADTSGCCRRGCRLSHRRRSGASERPCRARRSAARGGRVTLVHRHIIQCGEYSQGGALVDTAVHLVANPGVEAGVRPLSGEELVVPVRQVHRIVFRESFPKIAHPGEGFSGEPLPGAVQSTSATGSTPAPRLLRRSSSPQRWKEVLLYTGFQAQFPARKAGGQSPKSRSGSRPLRKSLRACQARTTSQALQCPV